MTDPQPLPRYRNPPVNEVIFSVQFERLPGLHPVHIGVWWDRGGHRQRYPLCEQRPRLDPVIEQYKGEGQPPSFTFHFGSGPPAPAVWFLTEDRTELLQIQDDRFTRNWTRAAVSQDYPSYEKLRPKFKSDFAELRAFVAAEELGEIRVTQVELTYINPIRPADGVWSRHGEVGRVLAPWSGELSEGFLDEPENVALNAAWIIRAQDAPVGRLHVSLQPVLDAQRQPVLLAELTARGEPLGDGVDGALRFLDVGHEWIVNAFTTLTTVPMHDVWDRIR